MATASVAVGVYELSFVVSFYHDNLFLQSLFDALVDSCVEENSCFSEDNSKQEKMSVWLEGISRHASIWIIEDTYFVFIDQKKSGIYPRISNLKQILTPAEYSIVELVDEELKRLSPRPFVLIDTFLPASASFFFWRCKYDSPFQITMLLYFTLASQSFLATPPQDISTDQLKLLLSKFGKSVEYLTSSKEGILTALYLVYTGVEPKGRICLTCGRRYIHSGFGRYRTYCSQKCMDTMRKREKDRSIRNKIEKEFAQETKKGNTNPETILKLMRMKYPQIAPKRRGRKPKTFLK